jgi:EAL domain-containing protein (putative c-di-GMP-specific phosphodiesterase class I)
MFSSYLSRSAQENRFYFKREFQINYQPVLSFADSRLESFEALLRWQPERTVLYPADFMTLLEDIGLIVPLGEWLLQETTRQLSLWRQQFPFCKPHISVNLSPKQLDSPDFLAQLTEISPVVKKGDKPFQVEIPSYYLAHADDHALARLQQIHRQGVAICVDDFEPNQALLIKVKQCPIAAVKFAMPLTQLVGPTAGAIDPALKGQRQGQWVTQQLAQTINQLHALGITTIAKGIESAEQYAHWDQLGCAQGQGYLFDQPLTASSVTSRLILAEHKAMNSLSAHINAVYNLNQVLAQWLGCTLLARYWQITKPLTPWLTHWHPNLSPAHLYAPYLDDRILDHQRRDLHHWVEGFLARCYSIMPNLPHLLERSSLTPTDLYLLQIPQAQTLIPQLQLTA